MNRKLIILLVGLAMWVTGTGSPSEARAQGDAVTTMDTVVVTATRQEEEIARIPTNVTVITEEDISNSTAQDIPSLLRSMDGIVVYDISGNRRNYTVDLRGFGETAGSNTLVLVDGRRTNQADLSGTDWTLIDLERIKRIEIIRGGGGAVFYGDNAAGGVINIITRKGEGFGTQFGGSYGSYDTFNAFADVSATNENAAVTVTASYLNSDGYRDNSQTEAADLGANLDYYLSDTLELNFSGGYHQDSTGRPGALRASELAAGVPRTATMFPRDSADIEDYYIKGGSDYYFLSDSSFKIDASYRQRTSDAFFSFTGGTFTANTEIGTTMFSPQIIIAEPLMGLDNNLTLGFDYGKAEEDILNNSSASGIGRFNLEKVNYGLFIHDEITPTPELALSAGYRYDKADFSFWPSTPNETSMDVNLYSAGINYNFQPNSHLYFNFARSFRYPVLDEIFNFFTNTIDTSLKPQTSNDFEAGIGHNFSDNFFAKLNLFYIDTDDEILFDPAAGIFGANVNLDGETIRKGAEISASQTFSQVTLGGSYTYTDAAIEEGTYKGQDMPGVPKHTAALNATYSPLEALSIVLNGTYIGERPFMSDFNNVLGDQESFVVLNAKVKYSRRHWSAFVDLNNITNEEYSEYGVLTTFPTEAAFYPSPEFNMLAGIRLEY